jgi:predicted O-methyltransferase YrrM
VASAFQSIEGWFDFDDIYELALRRCSARKSARFVEVGAYKGRSTCFMAERLAETGLDVRFDVVDTFAGDDDVGHTDLWPEFAANLERAGMLSRLTAHRRPSADAAREFDDQSLDFVFIDARHTYEAASEDLAAWWPKVRPGGLIAGHDYTNSPGVRAAVDEFVARHGLAHAFRVDRASWMIYRSLEIDAAYCINLARRTDRRQHAEAQFAAAGLGDVAFFEATDGATLPHPGRVSDGQAGCCASHLAVLRAAREAGHRHVLMFEDDIELAGDFQPQFAASLARCPASFDLCYVGAICVAGWGNYLFPFDDRLARVGSVCGTHAYVVNMDCQPAIEAGLADRANVIDDWYAHNIHPAGDSFACTPWLGFQASGWSDVAGTHNANGAYAGYVWR